MKPHFPSGISMTFLGMEIDMPSLNIFLIFELDQQIDCTQCIISHILKHLFVNNCSRKALYNTSIHLFYYYSNFP